MVGIAARAYLLRPLSGNRRKPRKGVWLEEAQEERACLSMSKIFSGTVFRSGMLREWGVIRTPPAQNATSGSFVPHSSTVSLESALRFPDAWAPQQHAGCVREQREIKVVLLGGSVTAGCGAMAPSQRCQIAGSWGHRLFELLRLRLPGCEIEVNVWGKNAVDVATQRSGAQRR